MVRTFSETACQKAEKEMMTAFQEVLFFVPFLSVDEASRGPYATPCIYRSRPIVFARERDCQFL